MIFVPILVAAGIAMTFAGAVLNRAQRLPNTAVLLSSVGRALTFGVPPTLLIAAVYFS